VRFLKGRVHKNLQRKVERFPKPPPAKGRKREGQGHKTQSFYIFYVLNHVWFWQEDKVVGFKPSVHKWKKSERLKLTAELDAAYFLL
jgi:hypothetical protein